MSFRNTIDPTVGRFRRNGGKIYVPTTTIETTKPELMRVGGKRRGSSGAIATDPYLDNVICLFRFDESGGSAFKSYGFVASTSFGSITTSAGSPFGGNALSTDINKYIELLENSGIWNFGSADFTVEFWFKLTTLGRYHSLIFRHNNAFNRFPFYAQINNSNKLETTWRYNSINYIINDTTALNANQWYFFKAGKEGSTVKVYLNNNLIGQATVSGSMESLSIGDSKVYLGYYFSNTYSMIGQLSNFRVTRNVFRDTTIPTQPFSFT